MGPVKASSIYPEGEVVAGCTSFPLSDEAWLPALYRDGRTRQVSLRQFFAESDQIRSIVGELPTMTFALTRLVLAILHRATDGPTDERSWAALWSMPGLPVRDIEDYLDHVRDRFDLLHPTMPFYQVADLRTAGGAPGGLEPLIADVPNGPPYLTARTGAALKRLSYAEAARWLVHCHAFDVSGIKSGAVGDPRVKGGKGYPIGTGSAGALGGVLIEGQSLRDTLLLNLIPRDSPYLDVDGRDLPVWERPPQTAAEEPVAASGPYGPMSLYTWQSRRIRLFGDGGGVTNAIVAIGDRLGWENRQRIEPMTAWRRSPTKEKALKLPLVYLPKTHDITRALWRGLDSLLPVPAARGKDAPARIVPPLSQWLARLRLNRHLPSDFRVTTRAVGIEYGTQQSVVDEVYHDVLTMPVQAFDGTGEVRNAIIDGAADADAAVGALRTLASNLCRAAGGSGRDAKDPAAAAGTRAAESVFAALDHEFRQWLGRLGPDSDPDSARAEWQQLVRRAVTRIGNDLVIQAGPSAWVGRPVGDDRRITSGAADLWFRQALARALPLAFTPDTEKVPA